MALRIGLTGGIGSGKTVVSKIFYLLGIPVYYSDDEARKMMNEDQLLRSQITALFGQGSYTDDKLNRSFIAAKVFGNKEKLDALNGLVHPITIAASDRWMKAQSAPYAIKEAALIFESGANTSLDYVIGVSAPAELRLRRVMRRDDITLDQVNRRIAHQLDEDEKMKRCDFVIINDEQQLVIPQVLEMHKKLLGIAPHDFAL